MCTHIAAVRTYVFVASAWYGGVAEACELISALLIFLSLIHYLTLV